MDQPTASPDMMPIAAADMGDSGTDLLVIRGEIEPIEIGHRFLVIAGAIDCPVEALGEGDVLLRIGETEQAVDGFFPPDATTRSTLPAAFRIDLPRPPGDVREAVVELSFRGQVILSRPVSALGYRSFVPVAQIEHADPGSIAGWVYDPGLWHNGEADALELQIGQHRVPVTLNVARPDLNFSAARLGRPIGFDLAVAKAMGAQAGRQLMADLRGTRDLRVALYSLGLNLATARLQVEAPSVPEPVAPPPAPTPSRARPAGAAAGTGALDFAVLSRRLGGWLFGGWAMQADWPSPSDRAHAAIDGGAIAGKGVFLLHPREDVPQGATGFMGFLPAGERPGNFADVAIGSPATVKLPRAPGSRRIAEREALAQAADLVAQLPEAAATPFGRLIGKANPRRRPVAAPDGSRIELHVDEAILAPGAGVLVMGWLVDLAGAIKAIRVRMEDAISPPLQDRWFPVDRPDVLNGYGRKLGVQHPTLGFHAFAPLPDAKQGTAVLEVEHHDGSKSTRPLTISPRAGRDALVRALADVHLRSGEAARLCTRVFGPPVAAIGAASLTDAQPLEVVEGNPPENPRCSIVVPLYGRIDFLQYQAALASEHDSGVDEYIYVLDDPHRKEDFLALARRVHMQLGIAFRLLVLPRNLGFAGASNAGLMAARGDYVCFMNSDIIPITSDWLDTLIGGLEAEPDIGLIGPRLLFEDGTVQHIGMEMERLPEMGGFGFPRHPHKGRMPPAGAGVRRVPMITGACMVMRRELAIACGGFSTEYIIGDFEDADLCMEVRSRGLECAVHDDAALWHLERQSQAGSANRWRHNLTLVNAWVFAGKWDKDAPDA